MRILQVCFLFLLLTSGGRTFGSPTWFDHMAYLWHPAIHRDLGLSDDQIARIRSASKALDDRIKEYRANGTLANLQSEALAAYAKQVSNILRVDQRKRLGEIAMQGDPLEALTSPTVSKAVLLDALQRNRIAERLKERKYVNEDQGVPFLDYEFWRSRLVADRKFLSSLLSRRQTELIRRAEGKAFNFASMKTSPDRVRGQT